MRKRAGHGRTRVVGGVWRDTQTPDCCLHTKHEQQNEKTFLRALSTTKGSGNKIAQTRPFYDGGSSKCKSKWQGTGEGPVLCPWCPSPPNSSEEEIDDLRGGLRHDINGYPANRECKRENFTPSQGVVIFICEQSSPPSRQRQRGIHRSFPTLVGPNLAKRSIRSF